NLSFKLVGLPPSLISFNEAPNANLKDKLGGTAVAFRTLINSAINWEYLAKYISNDKKTAWVSLIAPNTAIQASDQNGKIVQPSEFADKFNEQFFVDAQ
ncbi:hypothetical protein, partial [Mycoplasmopsis bovis]|uniref:hypothetical protein n=1 Tax=Mycoplasmopsis bovis TaxID=28903 RepID=UPI003D283779